MFCRNGAKILVRVFINSSRSCAASDTMFIVRRTIFNVGRNSIRNNLRLYCSASKQSETQDKPPALNDEKLPRKSEQQRTDDEGGRQKSHFTEESQESLMVRGQFDRIVKKDKETFLKMVQIFIDRDVHRRHHVEFIYSALKHLKEYGVERDLDVYKALIDVMPKEKFITRNMFQEMFMHYPKQQECMTFLLNEMEYNAVIPDDEVGQMLYNIFGRRSQPVYRYWRMMYWLPKFKNMSPWHLPDPVPNDSLELAKLAVRKMCTVDVESEVSTFSTEDVEESLDKTWIVSGQSPEQQRLLAHHSKTSSLKIEGPYAIWLRNRSLNYFTLIGDPEPDDAFEEELDNDDVRHMRMPKFLDILSPEEKEVAVKKPKRSIHQQDDGTVYAICATGTSTKDSLLSWVRLLEKNGNPNLENIPVLFKFRTSKVDDRALVVGTKPSENQTNKSPSVE